MFTLTRIKYQLFRLPGRTVLLLLAAIVFLTSLEVYLVNLHTCQAALDSLAENIPVTARVVNRNGTKHNRLAIDVELFDALTAQNVHNVLCTANAAGALGEPVQTEEQFAGGDTSITAANHFSAVPAVSAETVSFAGEADCSFLAGTEGLCGISEKYAEQMKVTLGNELTLPVYTVHYSPLGVRYIPIGEQSLRIVCTYPYTETNIGHSPDIVVPAAWLRAKTERAGEPFVYSSLSVVLDDPLRLTSFKNKLAPLGFMHVSEGDACDAISVEDEMFIKTAEELLEHLRLYKIFQIPFFVLIVLLVMLTVFLVMKSSRRDIAIARSLGEPKRQIAVVQFLSTMLTQLAGGIVTNGILTIFIHTSIKVSQGILLVYLLCAAIGTVFALAGLMRFDTLALLGKAD